MLCIFHTTGMGFNCIAIISGCRKFTKHLIVNSAQAIRECGVIGKGYASLFTHHIYINITSNEIAKKKSCYFGGLITFVCSSM